HDRQCLGMDRRLVSAEARGRCAEAVLYSGKSPRRKRNRKLRSVSATNQNSTQGCEGWLSPVRAELLPSLSPGSSPCTTDRHVDEPCRISVHRSPRRTSRAARIGRISQVSKILVIDQLADITARKVRNERPNSAVVPLPLGTATPAH